MKMRSFRSRIVAYKKKNTFVGVALDFDLLVQGVSMSETLNRLEDNIHCYLSTSLAEEESDNEIYRKAPKKYFQIYDLSMELNDRGGKSNTTHQYSGILSIPSRDLVNA